MKNIEQRFKFYRDKGSRFGNVLDIGAHEGNWTLLFKKIFQESKILMIEANETKEPILKLIGDYKIALLGSEDNKEVNYFTSDNDISTGNSIYKENSNFSFSPQKRKTKTLDTLLQSRGFYDLIKMDVQGSELDIIKGGMSVINNTKFLLLELQIIEFNKGAPKFYEVMSFLNKINFEIIDMLDLLYSNNGVLIQIDALFKNNNILKQGYK